LKERVVIIFAFAICAGAQNSYSVHRLVSDLPGMAEHVDANLKNPWGLSASGSSPFWISNNHTGTTTVYNSDGNPFPDGNPLVVTIPAPASGGANQASSPTGQTFNDTGSFELAPGKPATFLFCAEDGTISGWNGSASPNALNLVDNSASGAVYKGIAVARGSDGPRLYAANFRAGTIDAFDGAFNPVPLPDELRGPIIPGYAPFNIQRIGQRLYVTYAMRNEEGDDDVPGAGNGYVYVFTLEGRLVTRLIEGGALNAPWGLAIAPEYFGPFSQALLVANFGDGKINAYDTCSGLWLGALADTDGKDLALPGLWALRPGNGHNGGEAGLLYFTAGIPGDGDIESHGLFGSIRPAPPATPPAIPAPPENVVVDIRNLRFTPDPISVAAGGTLTWTNGDSFTHTVKGDTAPFASGLLDRNATFIQTFDTPGTYDYHCTIHPFMRGKVVVR
jgi:uncharacterized protein (TIGR03118 family)